MARVTRGSTFCRHFYKKIFEEEQEWRLIHIDSSNKADILHKDKEVINQVPQFIYKLDISEFLPAILDYVLVGPMQYKITSYPALKDDFKQLYPHSSEAFLNGKLKYSYIPHRPEYLE